MEISRTATVRDFAVGVSAVEIRGGLIRVAAIGPGIDWGRDRNREAAMGFPTMGIVLLRTFLGHLGRSWGSWSSWSLRNKFEAAVDCFGVTCDESALFYGRRILIWMDNLHLILITTFHLVLRA